MSDDDYIYIDAAEVNVVRRNTKYKHKLWKAESEKDRAKYVIAMSNINVRRQLIKSGAYNPENDPYRVLVSERMRYEIECETIFHCDPVEDELVVEDCDDYDYDDDDDEDDDDV
jgi:hypothetical protein